MNEKIDVTRALALLDVALQRLAEEDAPGRITRQGARSYIRHAQSLLRGETAFFLDEKDPRIGVYGLPGQQLVHRG